MAPHQKEQGVALVELVMVVAVALIIAAMAVPSFLSTRRNFQVTGAARDIAAEILLAKMRAASDFTQARARFDTTANTFQIEIWNKTGSSTPCAGTPCWYVDAPSGTMNLPSGITLPVPVNQTNQPPNTQATLGQAPACKTGPSGASPGTDMANTACVVFNSRGIPIDNSGAPTTNDAVYLTDGSGVYATTVSATGLLQAWRIDVGDTNAAHWTRR